MENWNPLTDTVPIHSWIHPWLPLMQARLEPLYSPIRSKLSSALQKWHPSDSSAKLILQPWKDVFTPGSWEAFMVKNIVPKLGKDVGKHPGQQLWPSFLWASLVVVLLRTRPWSRISTWTSHRHRGAVLCTEAEYK